MIVGSQEWSEVQPIDWRQITSLSLSLFVFPFVSLLFSHAHSLPLSNSFDVMETLQRVAYLAELLDVH